VESYNPKRMSIVLHNMKQVLKDVHTIQHVISQEVVKKGLGVNLLQKMEKSFSNVEIVHIDIELAIRMKGLKESSVGVYVELGDMGFQ
jgi:hypothetical protein